MRKLSESIWSDIQDRSMGETVRKEDDINLLGKDDFYEYLRDHYKPSYKHLNIVNSTSTERIEIPTIITRPNVYYLSIDFKRDEISISYSAPYLIDNLFSKLTKNFFLKQDITGRYYLISPSKFEKINNKFFIEVLDFFIENVPEDMLGVKKIVEESIWSDIQDRSAGETVRKEDDIDNLDYEEFFVYLTEHYQPKSKKDNEKIGGRTSTTNTNIIEIFIPIEHIDNKIGRLTIEMSKKDSSIVSMTASSIFFDKYVNLERMWDNYSGIHLKPMEKPTNKTVVDLIDMFLDVVDNPILEKIS